MADPMQLDPLKASRTQTGQMSGACPCCPTAGGDPAGLDMTSLLQNPNFIKSLLDLAQKLQLQAPAQGQQPGQQLPQPLQAEVPEGVMV